MDLTGDEIRRLRESRGLTQEQLAAAIGVGPRTVGNWERNASVPRNRMGMLIKFFDVETADEADDPLGELSDVALISELLRRAVARDSRHRNHGAGG